MTDTPAMMLWTDAYLADTGHLTTFEHGAYLLLLMAMWRAGGKLPNDEVRLARTTGVTLDKWRRYVARSIMPLLTVEGDFVTQKRLAREAGIARAKVAGARAAGVASSRAKSLKNINLNENPLPSRSNGKATLSEPEPEPLKDWIVSDETIVDEAVDVGDLPKRRKGSVELFQTVVVMWNEMAANCRLIAVRDITPPRQAAIIARSEDFTRTYDFPDALEGWRKLMGLVRGSPFLRGELNGFRCDFDFATRASSFTKIMEGKYEARQAAKRR